VSLHWIGSGKTWTGRYGWGGAPLSLAFQNLSADELMRCVEKPAIFDPVMINGLIASVVEIDVR
jgi:hypothetical protein